MQRHTNESGFTLIETLVALGILTVGAIGMAALFARGLQSTTSSPNELIATQKAAEAIESVFAARDSDTITWAQLKNTSYGGIILPTARPMNLAGADGILNTNDTGETLESPDLSRFTRKITISDLNPELRVITVTIEYPAGSSMKTYALTAYISSRS